ncbi:hypothetical protein QTP70_003327, partial [Hemibagrus guttatus]
SECVIRGGVSGGGVPRGGVSGGGVRRGGVSGGGVRRGGVSGGGVRRGGVSGGGVPRGGVSGRSGFGKVVSPVKMIPTGCKDPELRHSYSYRRQAFMILNNRDEDLNVIFKTKCDGEEYTIYATSGSLKCFGCGQEGHLARNCPEEQAAGEQETGAVTENIQEREQGENKQDSGEDNTQTEDQEENKQQRDSHRK